MTDHDHMGPGQRIEIESPMAKFFKATERLKELTDKQTSWAPIGKAMGMPAAERRVAERVKIVAQDDGQVAAEAAREIQNRLAGEYEAVGHQKRRAAMDEIALEIDQLRAMLPDLVIKAVAEMGAVSRQCREDAGR